MTCVHPHSAGACLLAFALLLSACPKAIPTYAGGRRVEEVKHALIEALARGALDEADANLTLCLEFAPEDGDCWSNGALIAFARGDAALAKKRLITAVRYAPEHAQAYNNLGKVYLDEGALDRAAQSFRRALKVNPDYREARRNLGEVQYRARQLDEAAQTFRVLVAVAPEISEGHEWLGIIALEQERVPDAIAHLTTATTLTPGWPGPWRNLGIALERAGRWEESRDAFTACLDADPTHEPCRQSLEVVSRRLSIVQP